jgi:hypothetical protein
LRCFHVVCFVVITGVNVQLFFEFTSIHKKKVTFI